MARPGTTASGLSGKGVAPDEMHSAAELRAGDTDAGLQVLP